MVTQCRQAVGAYERKLPSFVTQLGSVTPLLLSMRTAYVETCRFNRLAVDSLVACNVIMAAYVVDGRWYPSYFVICRWAGTSLKCVVFMSVASGRLPHVILYVHCSSFHNLHARQTWQCTAWYVMFVARLLYVDGTVHRSVLPRTDLALCVSFVGARGFQFGLIQAGAQSIETRLGAVACYRLASWHSGRRGSYT